MVLRGCNRTSRHARECERNRSRPVFFSSKFWRGDFTLEIYFFSRKLTPNGHRLSRCHTSPIFFFWLVSKKKIFTPNALLDFPERDTLVFRNTEYKTPLGHVTDTTCRPDTRLPLRATGATGIRALCTGRLSVLQGRWHLWESPVPTRSNMRFHISTTCFWLDPTSMLPKACCFPPSNNDRSHSFLGLAAKVYTNSMSNGTTKTLTSYYMRSSPV
jgi:hypothetical protein